MYACPRPQGIPEVDVEAVCLHALHAINSEVTFKSAWQARENALNLAEDVGSPLRQSIDTFSLPLRHKTATKSVRFSEQVQLHIAAEGHHECTVLPVQHDSLQAWTYKPWHLKKVSNSLMSSSRSPTSTSWSFDPISESLDSAPGGGADDPHLLPPDFPGDHHPDRGRSRHPDQERPAWYGELWDLLQAEGTRAEDDDGLVIFLDSYFIHHQHHRFHAEARPLRFDAHHADWEPGIRLVWEDLIDHAAELSVVWVRPDPPFAQFPGTVGTVIIQQGIQPDRVACLTSALLPFSPDFRKIVSAHSTELLLSRQQIIALAGAEAVCQHRLQSGFGECTIHVGVPVVQEAQVQITSGLGLTIRVPAPLHDSEVDHNLFLRVQRGARGHPAHSWQTPLADVQPEDHHPPGAHGEVEPEDTVSMMGRRPVPVSRSTSSYPLSSSSTTSSDDSTSDSVEHDWKQTVLFTLSGSSHSALLPWDDHASMRIHIAQTLQIPGTELLDHHIVAVPPDDLVSLDLCCILPQLLQEPRPSAFQCLVLLDVEVYEENDIQPSAFRRYAKWMPNVINWISFFRLLGFEHHCVRRDHQCRLWHNNRLVDSTETVPLRLSDGDYTKIFIGDPTCGFRDLSHLGISDDAFDRLGIPEDAFDEMSALQTNPISTVGPEHLQPPRAGPHGWSDLPRAMSCDRPFLAQQVEQHRILTASSDVPELLIPDSDNWQIPLGMHYMTSVRSFVSPEEAHTEWLTWYLHITDHPRCEAPRTLHLDAEREFWHRDVAILWRDRLQSHVATQIHLVHPEPPRAESQTHSGHLLIVQGTALQTVPALLSTKFQSAFGQRLSQMACFLPQFVTNQDLIELLRLDRVCQVRQCFAEVDGLELDHQGFAQLQHGEGVCFHVLPSHDATSLMQTAITFHSGPQSCTPSVIRWKLDQDDVVHNSTLDGREHNAVPHQAWVRLHGTRDPPQLQEDPLWSLWNRPQFQVLDQDHQPTMKFETWYVSSIGYPRCSRSRLVTLTADVDAWLERLRQVWSDRVSPHMHLELAIVHPAVIHEVHGGHLILMQAVTPEEKATLLSSYWNSRHGALQDRFAQLVPPRLSYPDLIHFNFLDTLCAHPEFDCRAQVGERAFESHMHWPVYHGLHLEVFIDHVAMRSMAQSYLHPVDAVDIPQVTPQEADFFVQPSFRRRRPVRDDRDDDEDRRQRLFAQLWSRAHLRERGLHQEPVMVFDTWFLSALNFPRCSTARSIALSSDISTWHDSLLRLWRDRRHPHFPVDIHQVLPAPPRHPGDRLGGHLILLQHHSPEEAGVLFSNYHGQESTSPLDRFAQLVPSALTLERIFWYNDWERVCDQPEVLCRGFYGNRAIRPDAAWLAAHGQHIELHLSRISSSDAESIDSSMLIQTLAVMGRPKGTSDPQEAIDAPQQGHTESGCFSFNIAARTFEPNLPPLASQSEFVQDLHQHWSATAFAWEDEARSTKVVTYFANHLVPHWRCDQGRTVTLPEDYSQWEALIRAAWMDQVDPGHDLDFYVTTPAPPGIEPGVAAYVIVIQFEQAQLVTSLTTLFDDANRIQGRSAVTTHEHIDGPRLIEALGLSLQCYGPNAPFNCWIWFRDQQLQLPQRVPGRNGYSFVVQLQPRLFWHDPALSLLQHHATLHSERQQQPWSASDSDNERLTGGRMAFNRRPLSLSVAASCSEVSEPHVGLSDAHGLPDAHQPSKQTIHLSSLLADTVAVQIIQGSNLPVNLPSFIEVGAPATAEAIQAELACFGHDCQVWTLGRSDLAFCLPLQWTWQPEICHVIYVNLSPHADEPFILGTFQESALDDLTHMKWLYQVGHEKAVILETHLLHAGLIEVRFIVSQGTFADPPAEQKQQPPWPPRQPVCPHGPMYSPPDDSTAPACLLSLGLTSADLVRFFSHSQGGTLCTSLEGIDLPPLVQDALATMQPLEHFDRLIVYTDGSSHSGRLHKSPAFVEAEAIPDAWAFIVLGERYDDEFTSSFSFLGWSAHQVRYDETNAWSLGATQVGPWVAEREALTWAFLWRLGLNSNVPTVFRSDSRLTIGQAEGSIGTSELEATFELLRGSYLALHHALAPSCFQVEHVFGHAMDPWNELCDVLAKYEACHGFFLPRAPIEVPGWKQAVPYLWMLFASHLGLPPHCSQGFAVPKPEIPAPVQPMPEPIQSAPLKQKSIDFHLSLATANILSMGRQPDGHAGKLNYLRAQFIAHGLNFVGLQETRTTEGTSFVDGVLRLCSGCAAGNLGVELWCNLRQPLCFIDGRPQFFAKNDFTVLHNDPRSLLVAVHSDWLRLWILVAHAPHSGSSLEVRTSWWDDLEALVHHHVGDLHYLYVCIDANASPGQRDDQSVFLDGLATSCSTPLLRHFLQEFHLSIPATGPIHEGPRETWTSRHCDETYMIDFVLVPQCWTSACTFSQLLSDFDLATGTDDHTASGLELRWSQTVCPPAVPARRSSPCQFDRALIKSADLHERLWWHPVPSWNTDVESHLDDLNGHFHTCLESACPRQHHQPKKPYITADIWDLRRQKLRYRKDLKYVKTLLAREALVRVFSSWRSHSTRASSGDDIAPEDGSFVFGSSLRSFQLKCYAGFRVCARKLKHLLIDSKRKKLLEVLDTIDPTTAASENPTQAEELPGILQQAQTGLGASSCPEAKLRSLDTLGEDQLDLSLSDLPSICALEASCRRVRAGKASGPDAIPSELCKYFPSELGAQLYSLLIKLITHGQEPLLHKGGTVIPIWKGKLAKDQCDAFRSILLSSNIGKVLHRTLRSHQSHFYTRYLHAQQIGGRPKVPVALGLHQARAFMRWHRSSGHPTAILFVDLQEAFYRVVRPLIIHDRVDDEALAVMAQRLGLGPDIMQAIWTQLGEPHALDRAQLPPAAQKVVKALHSCTHFQLPTQQDYVHTSLGSRPGDAWADVVFGFLMARVLREYEEQLIQADVLSTAPIHQTTSLFGADPEQQPSDQSFLGPVWMDDMALCLWGSSNVVLQRKIGVAASLLLDLFRAHAMTPNLRPGKTELMISPRGPGTRSWKKDLFGPQAPGSFLVAFTFLEKFDLKFVDEQPLPIRASINIESFCTNALHSLGEVRLEVRRRAAIAHQSFNQHRKLLYQCPAFSLTKRCEIFRSLILSRLLYGSESWVLWDRSSCDHFHSVVMKLYRRLLGCRHDDETSDEEVLFRLQMPTPCTLLRLARLRYLGSLFAVGPTAMWGLLNQDDQWQSLLCDDFGWLWSQLSNTCTLGDPRQHFPRWVEIIRWHRSYWRGLLRRAERHAVGQHCLLFQCVRTSLIMMPLIWIQPGLASVACVVRSASALLEAKEPTCSVEDTARHSLLDNRLPPLRACGPLRPPRGHRDFSFVDWDLHDELALLIVDAQSGAGDTLEADLRGRILAHPIAWTRCQLTLRALLDTVTEENAGWEYLDKQRLLALLDQLCLPAAWGFLQGDLPHRSRSAPSWDLSQLEWECATTDLLPVAPPVPRPCGRHQVVLHAFSGRRRPGDLQFYMEQMYCRHPEGVHLTVVSLDIVVDPVMGDVTNQATQTFWFTHASRGDIASFLCGPPCETWSRARFVQLQAAGTCARGPRPVRSAPELWGLISLSLRELRQVGTGNDLLCFALEMFLRLALVGAFGVLEHPDEPEEEHMPSIWKLGVLHWLLQLPGVYTFSFCQGLLGAPTPKPTRLLVLNLKELPQALRAHHLSAHLPARAAIGTCTDGSFKTAVLKEYPPAMSRSLASIFVTANDSATTRSALQAKIREKLEESGRGKGLKKKKKGMTKAQEEPEPEEQEVEPAPVESQGTPEHLRTNMHFADLRLSKPLLRACSELKFECPTPVQRDVIPSALGGSDILATAETGSGKTASFLLPTLERLCQSSSVRARRRDAAGRLILGPVGTKAVVLIPTRELAVQCHSMLQRLAKYTMVTHQLVAGGYIAHDQAASLRHQPDLVVATPGRLLDHLMNTQSVHMELLEIVVFDEADRLLEMGFRQECLEVLKRCAKGCQTMLFSATLNASVEDLAALALVKPQRIHASPVNAFVKAPSAELREAALLSLASRNYNSRVIIFCSTKEVTHRLAIIFGLCGLKFAEIHGNLSQVARAASLQQFQNGEADFLLATDIASRGLDLPDIKTVINFQLPVDVTRYIHRVGRTARMGRAGRAVTIYCPDEYTKVKQLGRQCCNKVKSKVLRRSIAAEAIQNWADRIAGFEQDIKSIIEEEQVDKELELADLLTQKSENMQKYKQDIQSRPAKEWFMSNKDKQKQQWEEQKKRKMEETNDLEEDDTSSKKKKEKRSNYLILEMRSRLAWLLPIYSLVSGDESLLVDDTCTNSEEGDCSLSLRQLRLHKAQERTESVHSEPQSIEPVSFVLPCTEPSEFEGVQLTEMKAEEEKEEQEEMEDAFAKYRGDDCFQLRVYWREKNNAITMPGTHRTRQSSPQNCQALCAKMTGCGHFSFWSDGGCLLTSDGAHPVKYHGGVLSGGPSCGSTSTDSYKEPAYKGPSVMKVGPRGGMDPPTHVQQYNGVAWPTMKITDDKEHHIYAIGDWGALIGTHPGQMIQYRGGHTAGPHTMARWRGACNTDTMMACFAGAACPDSCHYSPEIDYRAQVKVADALKKRAPETKPDFFINVGDNFYWGGVNTDCGTPMNKIHPVTAHQFNEIFERVYFGPGVDSKPWLSVLGNHDYGGFQFNKGWDQQIAYTWASDRWIMPGQYFMQRVEYPDFSVEVFMLDTNMMDSHPKHADPRHNICGQQNNPPGASCSATGGPKNLDDCFSFMWDVWRAEQKWIEKKLKSSTADWQIAATHFQCGHQASWYKKLHQDLGLDLLVTGHTHTQAIFDKWKVLGGLTCFITGGGGGITSENPPDVPRSAAYGFFDLTISKEKIKLESVNFRGEIVGTATVTPVKGPLTEEELEERRKERTRQRVLAKREAEKKQRLEEQAKARASARRGRKASQKQKGDRAAPTIGEQKFKEKVERRKKKGKKGRGA
eukprot:s102_g36.t1